MCDIYSLRYYRNCCFNDVQFDNIKYFAKTKQNAYREHTYISLRGDEGVKQCTRAIRVCSFTAWFSLLKHIKNDRKIQDMGAENWYIYVSQLKSHKECRFFFKISMITNVILILYNSSINNELILRDLHFKYLIASFCSISPTKAFCVSEQHDSDPFLNDSTV